MPNYEYKCEECGTVFDVIQRFSDEPLTTHPQCGGAVRRLMSAPAFKLKGSGWYATDYAKGNANGSSSSGNGEKTESGSKSESSKTESTSPAPASTTTTTETKSS
ncbi:MAG: FmdB family zinc ribbon protein [Bryobacteraceae bacterium]|jgi:putative FmdB family regulatory protein